MPNELIIIGGGQHGRVVADAAESCPEQWAVIGYIDVERCEKTERILGLPWLGDDDAIHSVLRQHPDAKVVLGVGGDAAGRMKLAEKLEIPDCKWATVIHSTAVVSPHARIGYGVVVLANAVVQVGAELGDNSIVNTRSVIEHDCKIGRFSHVAPAAVMGGGCCVGEMVLLGVGSRLRDHIQLGDRVTVGAGAVVVADIPSGETVAGVPAKPIARINRSFEIRELCIAPNVSLYEAMSVITKYGVRIALVTDSDLKLLGVITGGDIRKALLKHNNLNHSIEPFFTKRCHYASKNMSRNAALNRMRALEIDHLPVVDDNGTVVGLHTIREMIGHASFENIAVIMAGGKGTRLRPLTEDIPKPMLPVAGRPILEHIVLHLAGMGIHRIYIAVNYLGSRIEEYFRNGEFFGCEISYLREDKPLGSAGALSLLPQVPEHPFFLINGDLITQFNVEQMLLQHSLQQNRITVGAKDHYVKVPYGVLQTDAEAVVALTEKPEYHYLINGGVYLIEPDLLGFVPSRQEYFMTDLIARSLREKLRVGYYLLEGDWIDIGEHRQLALARGEIEKLYEE